MALNLVMFSDFICPFCYIGFETVRKLKPEFGFTLEWKGFQIHPEWPAAGMAAAEFRRGLDPETRRMMWARIVSLGETAGLEMKSPELLANSRLALEAAEFAKECGKAEIFEERIFRAYFNENLNIGSQGVLGELAAEVGLDRDELNLALESNRYKRRLSDNALAAHARGVDGVPTFFVGDYPLVGAQSEQVMRQILQRYIQKMAAAK
ncbi:MAG: DsbA family oxidoreductase [Deltaproteobacteria bacterium]|nr:DsbA family oxidoreductase [Deltaproteobacteria bacterium]